MPGIDVLLTKIDEGILEIHRLYTRDRKATEVPDDLLYAIKTFVQDCQSALDWTATAVKEKFLPANKWHPHFPVVTSPADFPAELQKQLKGLAASEPKVAAAFERHQPYHTERKELGYLKPLANLNKHRDFTAQEATPFRGAEYRVPGASVFVSPDFAASGDSFVIGGQIVAGPGVTPEPLDFETYMDWFFVDPQVRVMDALGPMAPVTRNAVNDVRASAEL